MMAVRAVCVSLHRCLAVILFVKLVMPVSLLAALALIVCSNVKSMGDLLKFFAVRLIDNATHSNSSSNPGCELSMLIKLSWFRDPSQPSGVILMIEREEYRTNFVSGVIVQHHVAGSYCAFKKLVKFDESHINEYELCRATVAATKCFFSKTVISIKQVC